MMLMCENSIYRKIENHIFMLNDKIWYMYLYYDFLHVVKNSKS